MLKRVGHKMHQAMPKDEEEDDEGEEEDGEGEEEDDEDGEECAAMVHAHKKSHRCFQV